LLNNDRKTGGRCDVCPSSFEEPVPTTYEENLLIGTTESHCYHYPLAGFIFLLLFRISAFRQFKAMFFVKTSIVDFLKGRNFVPASIIKLDADQITALNFSPHHSLDSSTVISENPNDSFDPLHLKT
jgi:hypothetical protein